MVNEPEKYQVVIVGGGPVGLFLGICLQKAGISAVILEKRGEVQHGSRSLGIHPVSLELFDKLGITNSFLESGIKIYNGHAFANNQQMGIISFEDCPKPYNFILALPQDKTETILEQYVHKQNRDLLIRNATVSSIHQNEDSVEVVYSKQGDSHIIEASFLVGADGKDSFVREQAGIAFEGRRYPDTYIMGDFSDNTSLKSDAAIFLCDNGVIESFPLHHKRRRWVVKTSEYVSDVRRTDIEERVARRINHSLIKTDHFMLSSFGVQKLTARPMVKNRIIAVGDAAHVVSPIGGQGMNLGWLGAWDLAQSLDGILNRHESPAQTLGDFEERRQKAARNAIRRAELNMRLGRRSNIPQLRNSLVYLMLHTPLSRLMARIYTMRGVEKWLI